MFGRGVVVAALADEVTALEEVLLGLSESDVVKPTRCAPWDVAALSVHTVGALNQALVGLDGARRPRPPRWCRWRGTTRRGCVSPRR
ncbi:hypothetical protein [Nocardiopsis sp. JB363]|uniref:hypothetical protein n=1 Tax=Nocardiopsis sp. JB363 TaxID=1434837 RepID=UPI001F23FAAD|nr:hypothetical protein [Nocardiopsis sp. JB363]